MQLKIIFARMKFLMVCLGNICRSPLAEGILQDKANKLGLNWEVDSAGTGNYHIGEPPHILSQKVAGINGIDISRQQARQFSPKDFEKFDRVYVMDADNYNDVRRMSGMYWHENKVDLLLNEVYPGQNRPVPDPWSYPEKAYHEVFELVDNACNEIIRKYTGNL